MSQDNKLYQEVVAVTLPYLGPASERFITRQIKTHLNKNPSELRPKDLAKLVDWLKVAIALLTEDGKMVQSYIDNLLKLARKR